jgi:tRNA-Thr(GGU) m(6)t(6)A37 methyltransferase TsaA
MNRYGELSIQLKPIGFVRNQSKKTGWKEPHGAVPWRERTAQMKEQREAVSEIVIDAGLEEALDGVEEFSHLVVLYWPHRLPPERRATTRVHPLGSPDFPEVGVFATQSPARPNPILTTNVRLLERRGNVLRVTGLDALDGSPVLDIKPHAPARDDITDIRVADWMQRIRREFEGDEA